MSLLEIISFYLLSKVLTHALSPFSLIVIYLVPFIFAKWIQLKVNKVPYMIFIVIPAIQFILYYIVGYSLVSIFIIMLFSYWRMYVYMREPYVDSQRIWLATVLFSFFILTFKTNELAENVSWFIILVILFVIIQILHHLRANDWYFMRRSYNQLFLYMAGFFVGIIFIYQIGLFILRMIVPIAGQGFAYIIGYPIVWILDLIRPDESNTEVRDALDNLLEPSPEQEMENSSVSVASREQLLVH